MACTTELNSKHNFIALFYSRLLLSSVLRLGAEPLCLQPMSASRLSGIVVQMASLLCQRLFTRTAWTESRLVRFTACMPPGWQSQVVGAARTPRWAPNLKSAIRTPSRRGAATRRTQEPQAHRPSRCFFGDASDVLRQLIDCRVKFFSRLPFAAFTHQLHQSPDGPLEFSRENERP